MKRKLIAIGALAELFRRELSRVTLEMFVAALTQLTDEQTERATAIAATKCKFMPTPSELIELANTGGASYESQALLAWEQLDKALTDNQPRQLSAATLAVVRSLGGFESLRQIPLSELNTWKRKSFLADYATLLKESPERLAAIAGPQSEIAIAFKKVQSREDVESIESDNRKLIEQLR